MGSVAAADEGVVVEVEADEVIGSDFSADSNGTRRFALTDEEREGLAKLFDSVDVDGSGGVDYLELASFLRAMSELDDDLKAAISPSNVYKLFARSDDDGDGRLSDGEFGAALVAWSAEEWSDADERRRAPAGGRHPPWEDSSGGDDGGIDKKWMDERATRASGSGPRASRARRACSASRVTRETAVPRRRRGARCASFAPRASPSRSAGRTRRRSRLHRGTFLRRRGLTHE